MKRDGVRPGELAWAKENLKGNMILALESTVSRMSLAARHEFYFGRIVTPEEWSAKIDSVRGDDVGEETTRLFDGRVLSLCVVGNVGKPPLSAADLAAAL